MTVAPAERSKELLVLATTPARPHRDEIVIDKKFVAGMTRYRDLWGGPVRCAMPVDANVDPPFSAAFAVDALPFRLTLFEAGGPFPERLLDGAAIVLAAGEDRIAIELGRQCRRRGVRCVFVMENIPETRVAIALLQPQPLFRKLKWALWQTITEPDRRRMLRLADGLQANGAPAARRYGALNADVLAFFDTRMSEESLPSREALEARLAGLGAGRPLRLAFSGRLDPIKGVDHLPRLVARLNAEGVAASLDIFGTGPLEASLRAEIGRRELTGQIRLHGAVDFDTALVPFMKENADLFVCCHRQSDPSCTYLETLACGVPIAGYANRAFTGILDQADVGWAAPVGDIGALARMIRDVRRSPGEIAEKSRTALAFARDCAFEPTWARRVGQLRRLAGLDP